MKDKMNGIIWVVAILESIPLYLISVTNIHLKTYYGAMLGSRWFGIENLVELGLSFLILMFISHPAVLNFNRNNLLAIAFVNFIMRLVRAYCIPICPEIAIVIGAIDSALFLECVLIGVEDLLNHHFTGRYRTLYTVRKKQGRYLCMLLGSATVVVISEPMIESVAWIYVGAAIISYVCRYKVVLILRKSQLV